MCFKNLAAARACGLEAPNSTVVLHKDPDVLLSAETSGASSWSSRAGGAEEMLSVLLADPDISSITDSQTCRLQGELEEFWITKTRIRDGTNHLICLNSGWTAGRPVSTLMSL